MPNHPPLTVRDAVRLSTICEASIKSQVVARLVNGDVVVGTARSIGDENGMFAGKNDDIRDCYLRVTTVSGWEVFWPVSDLVSEVGETFIAPYER